MKRDGFTLIEMIGVMVILGLLLLFAMPNVINYIKKGGDTKDKVIKTVLYEASKQYINDNPKAFKKDEKNTYCISVNTLATEGYVESPMVLSSSKEDITSETSKKTIKVTYDKEYKYELVDECTGIVNPTLVLSKGLTPVMYDEANEQWVVADPKNDDWYNYDEQKWANAVVLASGVTKKAGDTVLVDGTEAVMMYVWIPRFEYNYKKLETELTGEEKKTPPAIEVNFIPKETTKPSSSDYKVHPAFTFGTEQKSGMWVGKFELSSVGENLTTSNNLGCNATECTSDIANLRILPNISSLRKNNVSNFFYAIKGIANTFELENIDTHMMKNSEWGAVAYLSQSKYGKYGNTNYDNKYKEVYQNKSATYITGSSNGTPSERLYYRIGGQCVYNDMTELGVDTNNYKMGQCGPGASTTGNIYGVYDMSGGSFEYVMGAYGDDDGIYSGYSTTFNSGFTGRTGNDNSQVEGATVPEPKYYDIYKTSTANTACDGVCYGHGLSETSGWYGDYADMVTSSYPWFVRGGFDSNDAAGVFRSFYTVGNAQSYSARVVGFAK